MISLFFHLSVSLREGENDADQWMVFLYLNWRVISCLSVATAVRTNRKRADCCVTEYIFFFQREERIKWPYVTAFIPPPVIMGWEVRGGGLQLRTEEGGRRQRHHLVSWMNNILCCVFHPSSSQPFQFWFLQNKSTDVITDLGLILIVGILLCSHE